MSELTQCNYCSLQAIKAEAKRNKQKVTIMKGGKFAMGGRLCPDRMRGLDVFVHPLWIDLHDLPWTYAKRKRYWVCWFWELTDHCVC